MPSTSTRNLGKTSFVKEVLFDDPYANAAAVNQAWITAGMDGTISSTLVNKMRSELGLTGNLRSRPTQTEGIATEKRAYTGKKRGRKPKRTTSATNEASTRVETRGRKSARSEALVAVEAQIDRLIFMVMEIGGLTAVESALRESRRRLYRAFAS
jgi:hypothetical protein